MYSGQSHPRVKSEMLPILLKGHERSITTVKYNADGDLLFSAAKDKTATLWNSETGERIGTYGNHKGAIWDLDPSWDSEYLVTACADGNARLFETCTGRYICRMPGKGPVRAVTWGDNNELFATASDPFHRIEKGVISIFRFPSEETLADVTPGDDPTPCQLYEREIEVESLNDRATCLAWSMGNEHLIVGFDGGGMILYDVETGTPIIRKDDAATKIHTGRINRLAFNSDKSLMISASADMSAKLIDPNTLDVVRTYKTSVPVNGAVIVPNKPHIILGGGQEAMNVTTTSASQGKFESKFFHMVYGDEFGRVKGHFGPINALAVHPYGNSYASGSEDGYIRLHHFDSGYMNMPSYLPEGVTL